MDKRLIALAEKRATVEEMRWYAEEAIQYKQQQEQQ